MPAVAAAQSARIHVQTPDGQNQWHVVSEDDSLIVGSSQSCSVRLECNDVASMHCMIRLEHGRLTVQDWYTALGTYLNGERIQDPCDFHFGDEIRIGDFRLTAEPFDPGLDGPPATHPSGVAGEAPPPNANVAEAASFGSDAGSVRHEAATHEDDGPSVAEWAGESGLGEVNAAFREESRSDRLQPSEDGPAEADHYQQEPAADVKQLRLRITALELENGELRLQAAALKESAGVSADPFDLEMVELLKSEIEQLQHEVAQQDARIAELAAADRPADDGPDDGESAALVERLDQMLNELQLSDERVVMLQDLLRAADEATRAESEERRQLVAWMEDIEAKIGEREAEWQASQKALQDRINEFTANRERFDERLKELGNKEGTAASARLIEDLRVEIESLREKLDATEQARQALRKKIDDVEFQNSIEARDKFIEQKIREERLQLANEHAQIARERAEVARLRAQFDSAPAAPQAPSFDEATCRVQAFREHLKDIHKEESKDKDSKKLSSRLSRLWKRLDGN